MLGKKKKSFKEIGPFLRGILPLVLCQNFFLAEKEFSEVGPVLCAECLESTKISLRHAQSQSSEAQLSLTLFSD